MKVNKINKIWQDGDRLMADITYTPAPLPISMTFNIAYQPTWQQMLDGYYRTSFINGDYTTGEDRIATIQAEMQERFPGKYVVENFYNNKKMRFDLRLRFDDPKQETMWKIKNSA